MTDPVVIENSTNPRVSKILAGFAMNAPKTVKFGTPRVRVFGGHPASGLIKQAAASGRRGKGFLKQLFLLGQYRWCEKFIRRHPHHDVIVWNGLKGRRSLLPGAAKVAGNEVYFLEESPLPGRVTIDRKGVNFGSSLPRSAEFYKAWAEEANVSSTQWHFLREEIVPRGASGRVDVAQETAAEELSNEKFIFCPLQVPDDSQITVYGDWVKSVEDMIETLASASKYLPTGWHMRVKEHPSSPVPFGIKLKELECDRFRTDNRTNTMEQVRLAQSVLTINSSVGLHALVFDKPTIVLGEAFYAMDGLARKISSANELAEVLKKPDRLALDQESRDAFLNYLHTEYYPEEDAVISGRYGRKDVLDRDARRERILSRIELRTVDHGLSSRFN